MNSSPIPLTQSQLLYSLNMDAKKGPAKNEVCYHFINETVKFVVENYNVLTMLEIWVSSLFQNITSAVKGFIKRENSTLAPGTFGKHNCS